MFINNWSYHSHISYANLARILEICKTILQKIIGSPVKSYVSSTSLVKNPLNLLTNPKKFTTFATQPPA